MQVVLFCGGSRFRLPGQTEPVPKPMAVIGYRPILWHVMRWYAHHGLKDFVLCLGDAGDAVKSYFLRYDEALSNDFVLSRGGLDVELLGTDIQDWHITFADTGLRSSVGERLAAARKYLDLRAGEIFCANYADNVSDAPLPELLDDFRRRGKVAAFLSVRPHYSFHVVSHRADGVVTEISDARGADLWINGGFFLFRREIFDYLAPGEDLVEQPFRRLAAAGQLVTYRYEGFWTALDTPKDLQRLQARYDRGDPPWAPWLKGPGLSAAPPA